MAVSIRKLDAPLGAEIQGINLAEPLVRPDLSAIEEAWRTRLVIVARGQRLRIRSCLRLAGSLANSIRLGQTRMVSLSTSSFQRSTSFPTSSRTVSQSEILAPARPSGMPT